MASSYVRESYNFAGRGRNSHRLAPSICTRRDTVNMYYLIDLNTYTMGRTKASVIQSIHKSNLQRLASQKLSRPAFQYSVPQPNKPPTSVALRSDHLRLPVKSILKKTNQVSASHMRHLPPKCWYKTPLTPKGACGKMVCFSVNLIQPPVLPCQLMSTSTLTIESETAEQVPRAAIDNQTHIWKDLKVGDSILLYFDQHGDEYKGVISKIKKGKASLVYIFFEKGDDDNGWYDLENSRFRVPCKVTIEEEISLDTEFDSYNDDDDDKDVDSDFTLDD